ncbi:hypothetical protein BLNAU_23310 [Blattamonas nauphoetae]|uniref:Uncharacterized protein n=1 Tax=Blattamonas nauphoetae TaxID=2049346 RepID=A0ABQ9WQJ6_9EUKA|nr:hypothetical protein BLNAU_23310 [Blattamonas nauphoetae]
MGCAPHCRLFTAIHGLLEQPPSQPNGQPQPPTPAYGQAPYNHSSPSAYNPALSQSGYAQNASYQTPPPPQTLPTPGQPSPQPNTLQQSIYGQTPIPSAPPSAPPAEDFPQHPPQGYAPPCATNPPPPAPPPSYGAPPQQLPSPYGSGGHTQDPPPSSVAPYSQPPAPMGGPLPPHIESQLNSFYVHATQTGNFNTQQTVEACRLFGVSCDNDTAIRLLTEVAGAERRVTQARFVEVVGRYIASRSKIFTTQLSLNVETIARVKLDQNYDKYKEENAESNHDSPLPLV